MQHRADGIALLDLSNLISSVGLDVVYGTLSHLNELVLQIKENIHPKRALDSLRGSWSHGFFTPSLLCIYSH